MSLLRKEWKGDSNNRKGDRNLMSLLMLREVVGKMIASISPF